MLHFPSREPPDMQRVHFRSSKTIRVLYTMKTILSLEVLRRSNSETCRVKTVELKIVVLLHAQCDENLHLRVRDTVR